MSRRWSRSWCWGAVLLTMLGPAVALACRYADPASWTAKSQDGRFELYVDQGRSFLSGPTPLTYRDVSSRKVLWQRTLEKFPRPGQVGISPSGQYVAVTDPYSPTIILFGPDGSQRRWSLEDHFKKSELRRIGHSTCGRMWLGAQRFEGDVLVLEVLTGGVLPPIYEQPKGTVVRIDATTGQFTRDLPPPGASTSNLIEDYKRASECGTCSVYDLAEELVGRSEDAGIGGDAELSRFWLELLSTPQPPDLEVEAMDGLSFVGTDEELHRVARRPAGSPERNRALLDALTTRLPDEAVTYALRVLTERWPSDLLRSIAVDYLAKRGGTVAHWGLVLGLSDPSGDVRRNTLYEVSHRPLSVEVVEQMLSFCKDPDADVRQQSRRLLAQMLYEVGERPERQAIYELLGRADSDGRLKDFPEGWLILGAAADAQKSPQRAVELYTRGLKELKAQDKEGGSILRDLVFDAKLRLAFEAKLHGQQAEAEQLAREVLADPNSSVSSVCAPRPNPYGGPRGETGCLSRLSAKNTAENLLKELEGSGKK